MGNLKLYNKSLLFKRYGDTVGEVKRSGRKFYMLFMELRRIGDKIRFN